MRSLMVQFWKEGVDLENYVFFFIDLFAEGLGGEKPGMPWFRGDQDDHAARLAFRVRHPSIFNSFSVYNLSTTITPQSFVHVM